MNDTILLAVTGMSPAILTETVWALAHPSEGTAPVIPLRIIVVTTTAGRVRMAEVFAATPRLGGASPWEALRAALAAEGHDLKGRLRFGPTADDVRVITAMDPATGRTRELEDLRTPADNEAAADFLLEVVRGVVENPDTHLVASLAGGRKTMGALLYASLTLIGRETDRLTHVLVNEPYESVPGFWFPGQPGASTSTSAPAAATAPLVELADVPFVPLRNLFERDLGRKAGGFLRLVETARTGLRQHASQSLRVTLDTVRRELVVDEKSMQLPAAEFLLLLFLAIRAKQGQPHFSAYKEALDPLNDFRREQWDAAEGDHDWRRAAPRRSDWDERAVTKVVSSLKDKLRRTGDAAALLAGCLPERGRCSLDLKPALLFLK